MTGTAITRAVLGGSGVALGLYGAWLLVSRQDGAQLRGAALWLFGGVILHDVVISAVVLVVGLVVTRLVPLRARGPVTVGAVVLGSVTLLAVPVLGRFGAKSDNPTLLDRDYAAGWWTLAALVVVAVAVATLVRWRRDVGHLAADERPTGADTMDR